MRTIQKRIDVVPNSIPAIINVNQYDSDFSMQFTLYSSNGSLTIPSGTTASIRGTKADGNGYSANATSVNPSTGLVVIAGSQQMTAAAGRNEFELVLEYNNKELSTANFILQVERAAMDAGTITSDSVLRELNAIIAGAETATQAAEDAEDAADRAEAAAQTLEIDDTLTQTGQAADAKKVGDEIANIKDDLSDMQEEIDSFGGISDDVKTALLDVVSHIALWTDGNGQEYYNVLYSALYGLPLNYPNLNTGNITENCYYDNSGEIVTNSYGNYINDKYFELEPNETYIWVRGFDGNVQKNGQGNLIGGMHVYRVCYYDSNKDFIERAVPYFSTEFGVVENRYYTLNPPQNAKYFRVSWGNAPMGNIYREVPDNLYAVTMVLANLDDSNIPINTTLVNGFSILRNGVDITHEAAYGRDDMAVPEWTISDYTYWIRNVFPVLFGGSPETGEQNPDTTTRIQNRWAFLAKSGDVIRFNNVKAGVRAERISDGHLQYTTAWITDNSDFVIGA